MLLKYLNIPKYSKNLTLIRDALYVFKFVAMVTKEELYFQESRVRLDVFCLQNSSYLNERIPTRFSIRVRVHVQFHESIIECQIFLYA